MKKNILFALILLLTMVSTACAAQDVSGAPVDATPSSEVEDLEGLVEALQAAGAEVELGDGIEQPFLSVQGQIIKVDGADVQVFEYASAEAMGLDASQVTEDGSSIGTSMIGWVAAPHFYRTGRLLILYVGEDSTVIDRLESVVGPQFAGR